MIPLIPSVEFDAALVRKMNQMGPRYTSYPTADRFHSDFGAEDYRAAVARLDALGERMPLSLYVHIPFCESLCYYCGCNKIITQDKTKSAEYLGYLEREMVLQAAALDGRRKVDQLHFGGGTPTYLSDAQMDGLLGQLRAYFDFAPDEEGEFSIEVDPRTVTPERIATLRRQGFNRISLGIQDFDPAVQQAVNRIQSHRQTMDVLQAARATGFRSISVDLIYGLPLQSVASFGPTLDKVIAARPDRVAVYNYAHMPQLFKAQRLIKAEQLPDPEIKLAMLGLCIERLTAAGMCISAWTILRYRKTTWRAARAWGNCSAISRAIPPMPMRRWWRWACRPSARSVPATVRTRRRSAPTTSDWMRASCRSRAASR